jgi:hypothetical protein
MRTPPDEIHTALYRAALGSGVPISLLTALAWAISHYDPRAEVTLPKPDAANAKGRGLFGLSQRACDVLGVTDATDPVQNARAAATLLARLGRGYKWDPQAMTVAFVFGRTATEAYVKARTPYPIEVRRLLEDTLNAQVWFQQRAEPDGRARGKWPLADTQAAKLDNAIEGLAAANAGFAPAQRLVSKWRKWRDKKRKPESVANEGLALKDFWKAYDTAYARAPITDSRTPPPSAFEPDVWGPVAEAVEREIREFLGTPPGWFGQGAAAVGLALLLWSVASLGGRRR